MKKIISLTLVFVLAFCFASCQTNDKTEGENGTSEKVTESEKNVDLAQIKADMLEKLNISEPGELTTEDLLDFYGIKAEDVKNSACYTTMGVSFPEEVVMIEAVDEDALKRIEEKMNNRIAEVKIQSQDYDPENYAMAQKSEVNKQGNFIAMFLSPGYDELVKIFNSYF